MKVQLVDLKEKVDSDTLQRKVGEQLYLVLPETGINICVMHLFLGIHILKRLIQFLKHCVKTQDTSRDLI
jgi:hypothetical protein